MESPLKKYRESQTPQLSQSDLAGILGVARPTVTRWETGARKVDRDLLQKVTEITGIPKDELRPDLAALMRNEAAE